MGRSGWGRRRIAGGFYENGAAPDYYASQGYLLASNPSACVPDGRYRVELYLNGRLAADPVEETLDMPELITERRTDLGVLFCRPAGWAEATGEPGRASPSPTRPGRPGCDRPRVPARPDGEAGAPRCPGDGRRGAAWDPAAVAARRGARRDLPDGAVDAQVQWYQGTDGWLKVYGGATSFGTVITVALAGTAEWVDGTGVVGPGGVVLPLLGAEPSTVDQPATRTVAYSAADRSWRSLAMMPTLYSPG